MKHVTGQSCVSKLQTCNLLGPESQVAGNQAGAEDAERQTQQPGGCLRKMSAPVGCHCCCMHNEQASETERRRARQEGESPSALVRQLEKFCFFFFSRLLFSFHSFFFFLHNWQPDKLTVCLSECEETNECNCVCHFRFPSWNCTVLKQRRNQCTRMSRTGRWYWCGVPWCTVDEALACSTRTDTHTRVCPQRSNVCCRTKQKP